MIAFDLKSTSRSMMNILIQHIVEMHQSGYCENNVLIGPGGIIQKLKFTQACDLIVGHGY